MKVLKLNHGNIYFYGNIVFNRDQEVEVNDELAAELLKEAIVNYDSDMGNMSSIPYFVEVTKVADKPKSKAKAEAVTESAAEA